MLSRVLPELYEEAGLHRMEPYFSALRSALLQAAPAEVADPRVVVLSPGTHSETAYDQAFIANILGFPLVQGEDLVVRDGWVWMKPAGFPQHAPHERVDVILRRVDAEWCDPLELRAGSQLGVAGLTEAVRRGRVRLVNGLGAGVLENPGLMPFMPAVCERLLGEQLRLPSVSTQWCGDPEGLAAVLAAVDGDSSTVIVRQIDGRAGDLEGLAPAELRERILSAPHRFVGQERMPLSQAPAWGDSGRASGRANAHPLVLRAFTVRDGAIYRPLVGGLATLVDDRAAAPSTKDVWVLKAAPGDPDQGIVEVAPLPLARAVPVLSPRAVEDMFWSGRYTERAEDLVRLVITAGAYAEQLDYASSTQGGAALRALIGVLQRLCGTRWLDTDLEQRSLLLDADRPGSAAHSLERLRDALEGVRDQLSVDTWRAFGSTDRAMKALRGSRRPQIAESASRMLGGILSLQGVTANMIRDDGWHAIEAGRYLERSLQVCTLLAATTTASLGIGVDRAVHGRRADGRRELGHPSPPLPRQRARRRRAGAAADRSRQPAVDLVLARPAAVPPVEARRLDRVDAPGAAARAPRGLARGRRHRRPHRADGRAPTAAGGVPGRDARAAASPRRCDRASALRGRPAAAAALVAHAHRADGHGLMTYGMHL